MNGINAPKVVECLGSDGCKYRQLAKSGNDDLRQDAVRFLYIILIGIICLTVVHSLWLGDLYFQFPDLFFFLHVCLGNFANCAHLAYQSNDLQVMEQFFGLVNTFLQNNRDTQRRRLRIRTYKVTDYKYSQLRIIEIHKNCLLLDTSSGFEWSRFYMNVSCMIKWNHVHLVNQ